MEYTTQQAVEIIENRSLEFAVNKLGATKPKCATAEEDDGSISGVLAFRVSKTNLQIAVGRDHPAGIAEERERCAKIVYDHKLLMRCEEDMRTGHQLNYIEGKIREGK